MERNKYDHSLSPIIAAVVGAAIVSATLLGAATNVAEAQTEPPTAANGVLLPSAGFDPAAARNEDLAGSAIVAATSADPVSPAGESAPSGTPEAVADAPETVTDGAADGDSMTTIVGSSDVAVSSVGGSYEVDRPNKRSDRGR